MFQVIRIPPMMVATVIAVANDGKRKRVYETKEAANAAAARYNRKVAALATALAEKQEQA